MFCRCSYDTSPGGGMGPLTVRAAWARLEPSQPSQHAGEGRRVGQAYGTPALYHLQSATLPQRWDTRRIRSTGKCSFVLFIQNVKCEGRPPKKGGRLRFWLCWLRCFYDDVRLPIPLLYTTTRPLTSRDCPSLSKTFLKHFKILSIEKAIF